jgi:VRR-NUC domain
MMPALARSLSEEDWQRLVVDAARYHRWRVFHTRPARTAAGWRTPVSGDGAGFVDLVLVRPPRVLFVELKSQRGRLSALQEAWLADLAECPGVERYVWRPSDWETVMEILQRVPA